MTLDQFPSPGLDGTYRGSCVICLHGTDTALGFEGEAEWVIAALMVLGIDNAQEAADTLQVATGSDPDAVADGDLTVGVRVCLDCAARTPLAGLPEPLSEGVPVLRQRSG